MKITILEYADIHRKIGIECTYEVKKNGYKPVPNIHIYKSTGECVFISSGQSSNDFFGVGIYKVIMWIPADFLNEGIYTVGIALSTLDPVLIHFFAQNALTIEMIEDMNLRENDYKQSIPGTVRPKLNWETHQISETRIL